mmetsp:Transcript_24023/g.34404  ORF Transcript_24023/g.34404 Transcript_24023/m.34404 type:complete len:299 (-) Transcript_24023:39-935(-)
MIRLQPLSIHEKRSAIQHGGFVDLLDPKFIDRGFDSLPGSRTDFSRHQVVHLISETETDEESQQEIRKRKRKLLKKPIRDNTKRQKQQTLSHLVKRRKQAVAVEKATDGVKEDETKPYRLFTVVDDLDTYERLMSSEVSRIFEIKGDSKATLFPYSERTYTQIVGNDYPEPNVLDYVNESAMALIILSKSNTKPLSTHVEESDTPQIQDSEEKETAAFLGSKSFYRCCHPSYENQMKKTVHRTVQRLVRDEIQWSQKFEWKDSTTRSHLAKLPSQLESLVKNEKSRFQIKGTTTSTMR